MSQQNYPQYDPGAPQAEQAPFYGGDDAPREAKSFPFAPWNQQEQQPEGQQGQDDRGQPGPGAQGQSANPAGDQQTSWQQQVPAPEQQQWQPPAQGQYGGQDPAPYGQEPYAQGGSGPNAPYGSQPQHGAQPAPWQQQSAPQQPNEPQQWQQPVPQAAPVPAAAAQQPGDFRIVDPRTGEVHPVPDLAQLPETDALLVVVSGPDAGAQILLDTDVVTVGRSPNADIFLDDVTVSRKHAEFVRTPTGFTLRDTGSLNGTYVGRQLIDSIELQNGADVQIGKFRMIFQQRPRTS